MTVRQVAIAVVMVACSSCSSAPKPLPVREPVTIERSPDLERSLAEVASEATTEFPAIKELSIAVIDLKKLRTAAWRGDVSYYPASVVKLAYLAYYEASKEAGRVEDTPELVRAVKDMISVSSNDATGFVVDSITGTTSGPEIGGAEWETWKAKRNVVTEWYRRRGFTNLNANQKAFCEDGYGREHAYRDGGKNRNRMTASEAARVFAEIVRGEVAGSKGTDEMLGLLAREIGEAKLEEGEPEIARLAGKALPAGSKLWSKSGDAYDVRHLVGRVLLPNGNDFVFAVFTKGVRDDLDVISRIYGKLAERI
jgi:beta-lactamase class A